MTKKSISLIVIFVFFFSICGCNKQNKIEENYLIKYSEDKRKSNLEYRITPNQIGKTTYLTNIEKKDKAKKIVDKKINERIHPPEIENDIHIHNKYYGG